MKTLNDKIIVVTGAGGRLAGAVEDVFREAGAQLVLVDQDMIRIQGRASSYDAPPIEINLTTLEGAKRMITQVKAQTGRIDGLIHLVGDLVFGEIASLEEEDFTRAFDSNVRTLFNVTKAVLPELLNAHEGFLAALASHDAWQRGGAGSSLFAASKSAVASFMRSLDLELKGNTINVSVVYPLGLIDTKLTGEAGYVAPRAIAQALLHAALADVGGRQLEVLVYPPRQA
jgi:NADP-dependent 3-hydroxy acid dehydrogenase YdfG